MTKIGKPPVYVVISGNIGAGKSTLLEELTKTIEINSSIEKTKILFVEEPIKEWGNHLEEFYKNPEQNAFVFQIVALTSRATATREVYEKALTFQAQGFDTIIISERCCMTDLLFAVQLANTNTMRTNEYDAYRRYIRNIVIPFTPEADLHLYVRTNPQRCLERIQTRNRSCEKGVDLKYLRGLHDVHERFFKQKELLSGGNLKAEDLPTQRIEIIDNTHEDIDNLGLIGLNIVKEIINNRSL